MMPPPISRAIASRHGRLAVFLLAHVAVWTLFATFAQGGIHHDLAEAWAWAREPAFGYAKHPPLSAWLALAWFEVFPRETWAFFLLAETNAAVGLAGAYALAGRFLREDERWAGTILLCLTPFYNLLAIKFNANTVQLAVWPWTAYFLVRSLETRSLLPSIMLGLCAGLAVLGKYYGALLLASCAVAALLHPQSRAYFASPAPYAALAACALILAPHVWWVLGEGGATLHYAMGTVRGPRAQTLLEGAVAGLRAMLMVAPAAIVLWLLGGRRRRQSLANLVANAKTRDNWWFMALALGPFALTLFACAAANVRISVEFMIPIFFMWPTLVLVLSKAELGKAGSVGLWRTVLGYMGAMVLAAPAVALAAFHARGQTWIEPRQDAARAATRAWHEAFGRPLPVVAGEETYTNAFSFYSADAPLARQGFDAERLADPDAFAGPEGALIVCRSIDAICLDNARRLSGAGVRVLERDFAVRLWGMENPPRHVVLTLVPPNAHALQGPTPRAPPQPR